MDTKDACRMVGVFVAIIYQIFTQSLLPSRTPSILLKKQCTLHAEFFLKKQPYPTLYQRGAFSLADDVIRLMPDLLCSAPTVTTRMLYAGKLRRKQLPTEMDRRGARSLAGIFVEMIRQRNAQRRHLVAGAALQCWKASGEQSRCFSCKRRTLFTATVAGDNSEVISVCAQNALAGASCVEGASFCKSMIQSFIKSFTSLQSSIRH